MAFESSFVATIANAGQQTSNAAALTEVGTATRNRLTGVDCRRVKKARWSGMVTTAGGTGQTMRLQASLDGSAWTTIMSELIDSTGAHEPAAGDLPVAFRTTNVKLRLATENGDAVTTPTLGIVYAHLSRR
jgi:hypothetical protein